MVHNVNITGTIWLTCCLNALSDTEQSYICINVKLKYIHCVYVLGQQLNFTSDKKTADKSKTNPVRKKEEGLINLFKRHVENK